MLLALLSRSVDHSSRKPDRPKSNCTDGRELDPGSARSTPARICNHMGLNPYGYPAMAPPARPPLSSAVGHPYSLQRGTASEFRRRPLLSSSLEAAEQFIAIIAASFCTKKGIKVLITSSYASCDPGRWPSEVERQRDLRCEHCD